MLAYFGIYTKIRLNTCQITQSEVAEVYIHSATPTTYSFVFNGLWPVQGASPCLVSACPAWYIYQAGHSQLLSHLPLSPSNRTLIYVPDRADFSLVMMILSLPVSKSWLRH